MKGLSAQILRAFSLVVTDRRWAAPLSASALGFGLFVGVAIGPSAAGTLAGGPQVVEVASQGEEASAGDEVASAGASLAGPAAGGAEGGAGLGVLPESAPLIPAPAPEPVAAAAPQPPPPPSGEAPREEGAEGEEGEEATALKGIVAHVNPAAGSYALAIAGGELVPVHAKELPKPGARLTVTAGRLANGTFAEVEKPQRSGRVAQAVFRGTVTFADPDPVDPAYAVSGRGASLPVHLPPDPTGAAPALPAIGAYVKVTAGFEQRPPPPVDPAAEPAPPADVLVQRRLEVEPGEPTTYLDLAGILTQILPETAQLTLSADGAGESGAGLTLTVPAAIDASRLEVGDSYLATATVAADGTLALAGIASDEHRKGADDAGAMQGDLKRAAAG